MEEADFLGVGVLVDASSSSTSRLIGFVRRFLALGGAVESSRLRLVPAARFGVDVVALARFGPAISRSEATNQNMKVPIWRISGWCRGWTATLLWF